MATRQPAYAMSGKYFPLEELWISRSYTGTMLCFFPEMLDYFRFWPGKLVLQVDRFSRAAD